MRVLRRLKLPAAVRTKVADAHNGHHHPHTPIHHRQRRRWLKSLMFAALLAVLAAISLHGSTAGYLRAIRGPQISFSIQKLAPLKRKNTLLVVHPGFGEPHFEDKLGILRRNIATIISNNAPWKQVTFLIFCYTVDAVIPEGLKGEISPGVAIEWIQRKGVIMEYLYYDVPPSYVAQYNYVLTLVDDVELSFSPKPNQPPMDWTTMLQLQQSTELDILACCLGAPNMTHWSYMIQQPLSHLVLRQQERAEWFCYLMKPAAYARYYSFIDPNNPWSWGMDFIMTSQMHLKTGVMNSFVGNHHFQGGGDSAAWYPMQDYLAKYNTSHWEETRKVKLKNAAQLYFDDAFPGVVQNPDGGRDLKNRWKDPEFVYDVGTSYSSLGDTESAIKYWLKCLEMVIPTIKTEEITTPNREIAYLAASSTAAYVEFFMDSEYELTKPMAEHLTSFFNKKIPFNDSSSSSSSSSSINTAAKLQPGNNNVVGSRHITVVNNVSNTVLPGVIPTGQLVAKIYYQASKILPYRKETPYQIARLLRTYANDHEACFDAALIASTNGPNTEQTLEANPHIEHYYIDGELCSCGNAVENPQRVRVAMAEGMSGCSRLASLITSHLEAGGADYQTWLDSVEATKAIYVAKDAELNKVARVEERRKAKVLVTPPTNGTSSGNSSDGTASGGGNSNASGTKP